jgi:hypothetical protein
VLYKHDRLEKKLRERGRTARAEILSMRTEGRGNKATAFGATDDDLTKAWTNCWLHLRVMPEGEAPFEAKLRTRLNTFKSQGDTLPVLYDPDDHDRVLVDFEADAREAMDRARRDAEARSARADGAPALGAASAGESAGASAGESAGAFTGDAASFADSAAGFAEQAAKFREQAAALRAKAEAERQPPD